MKTKNKIIVALVSFVGIVCLAGFYVGGLWHQNEIEITEVLKKQSSGGYLCLKNIEAGQVWNRMLILGPYDNIEHYEVDVSRGDKSGINSYSKYDSYCIIVLLSNEKVISYAPIPRIPFDFTPAAGKYYGKDKIFALHKRDRHSFCVQPIERTE